MKYNSSHFPSVFTNGSRPHCNFCGSIWGVDPALDYRFGHTEQEARAYGWFFCCGNCYARVLVAAYSNRPEMKPAGYRGYRP